MRMWLLIAIFGGLVLQFGATGKAASLVFVRSDGSDAVCNGTANAPATAAPDCAFATLAHGIDQVDSGGEVQVAAGTYATPAIPIVKDVRVRGVPGGARPEITGTTGPVLHCQSGYTCVFLDLELKAGAAGLTGIVFSNLPAADGSVRRVDFDGFDVGVSAGGPVTIADNTFVNTKRGIAVHSAQASGAKVVNNVYTGSDVFGSFGIWLFDATTATLKSNLITDADRGIYVDQSYGEFSGNTITGSSVAISSGTGNFTANLNNLAGNTSGISAVTSTVNAELNWWGCNAGPGNPGCSAVIGTGIDFDPWLVLSMRAQKYARGRVLVTADISKGSDGFGVPGDAIRLGTPMSFAATPATVATLSRTTAPMIRAFATTRIIPGEMDGEVVVSATFSNQTVSRKVLVDRNAPAATITKPADGATLANLSATGGTVGDPLPASGAVRVLVAIRRELANGKCRQWNGSAWVARACGNRVWLKRPAPGGAWNMPLPGSNPDFDVPGRYSIFVRGVDRAGNTAPAAKFTRGANWIRFEVK